MPARDIPNDTILLVIKHPKVGDADAGIRICGRIRDILSGQEGRVIFFHDATEMMDADFEYALCFRDLDYETRDKTLEAVCAIPRMMPRVLAFTVAKGSGMNWEIFKNFDDALKSLYGKGVQPENLVRLKDEVSILFIATQPQAA